MFRRITKFIAYYIYKEYSLAYIIGGFILLYTDRLHTTPLDSVVRSIYMLLISFPFILFTLIHPLRRFIGEMNENHLVLWDISIASIFLVPIAMLRYFPMTVNTILIVVHAIVWLVSYEYLVRKYENDYYKSIKN